MELVIPAPLRVYFQQHHSCECNPRHHSDDNHPLSHTIVAFDTPDICLPRPGRSMRLTREYTYNPSASLLALDRDDDMETKENEKLDNTFFAFLDLPREIRDDIYVRVLGASEEHWATMIASVPWTKSDRPMSDTRFEYSFRSKQLQLLCHQIWGEVLEVSMSHAQDIRLHELGMGNFDAVLTTFKSREPLRLSARNITLVYSTPILSRKGGFKGRSIDRCSFLTQIIEPFLSLIKLCPNVDSAFISLIADTPSDTQSRFGLYVPCRDRYIIGKIQVDYIWYEVAEWERVIRQCFSMLRKGLQPEIERLAIWAYSCSCAAYAHMDIVVSKEEKRRARRGARCIDVKIAEELASQGGSDEEMGEDGSYGETGEGSSGDEAGEDGSDEETEENGLDGEIGEDSSDEKAEENSLDGEIGEDGSDGRQEKIVRMSRCRGTRMI
ncbi:hypothetical protein V498_06185 [Pseudogymnoascus sp. VKM F-4517 (FW-2822)]|nr:hypothetical protein V498_06185 [Pseudogymnoascus sp. VKM F-4517 (FW-2822)]